MLVIGNASEFEKATCCARPRYTNRYHDSCSGGESTKRPPRQTTPKARSHSSKHRLETERVLRARSFCFARHLQNPAAILFSPAILHPEFPFYVLGASCSAELHGAPTEALVIRPASIRMNALLLFSLLFSLARRNAQQVFNGTADDGSFYQIVLPTNWNHQLVLYAHGIVDPQAPIALPSDAGFTGVPRCPGARGFAVAYSSYAANGYAIQEGIRDTDQLRGRSSPTSEENPAENISGRRFAGQCSRDRPGRNTPRKNMTESCPCAVSSAAVRWKWNTSATRACCFDYFFPGVIPGTLLHTPLLPYDPGSPIRWTWAMSCTRH